MATAFFRRLSQALVLSAAILLLQLPQVATADSNYGRSGYGTCPLSRACPVAPPTTITLPSGLDVILTISEGQTIPRGDYTIQATPLGGTDNEGFTSIDFYVDDQLIATVQPDSTGTALWTWNTINHPGSTVKLVIHGSDGQTVTKVYHVHIAPAQSSAAPGAASAQPKSPLENLLHKATQAINALPLPLIRAFPYSLFLILFVNFMVLMWQLKKELREYDLAKRLLAQQRDLAGDKRALLQLLSHYLRTPLTIIAGGIDMLAASTQANWNRVRQSLSENVELLITQTRTETEAADGTPVVGQSAALHFWRRPGLFVPVVLLGIVVALFDYAADRTAKFDLSQTNALTQVLLFASLAVGTYLLFRALQLRRRDAQELTRLLAAQAALAQARDDVAAEMLGLLQGIARQLQSMVATLPGGQAKEFIQQGCDRLVSLLQKFQLAAQVRGTHIAQPITRVPLGGLLQQASADLAKTAAERHIQLPTGDTQLVPVRDAELFTRVVASLLDNAVAYSEDNASVEVECHTDKGSTWLTITDHGKSIPPDKLDALFTPFQKLEGVETFDHEGLGFSLYLARLIMNYLGGSISASSPQGGGVQVTLVLPNA